jgi:hypothetical protein
VNFIATQYIAARFQESAGPWLTASPYDRRDLPTLVMNSLGRQMLNNLVAFASSRMKAEVFNTALTR